MNNLSTDVDEMGECSIKQEQNDTKINWIFWITRFSTDDFRFLKSMFVEKL